MTTETTKRAALPLTEAQIAELERLEAVAGSGPWFVWRGASGGAWLARDADGGEVIGTESTLDVGTMEMIAATRNALPSLLAEVRGARAASRASPEAPERRALENVRALVARDYKKIGSAIADHLLRFCREGGVESSLLRASPEEGRAPERCDHIEPPNSWSRGRRCLRVKGHQSAHRLDDGDAAALWAENERLRQSAGGWTETCATITKERRALLAEARERTTLLLAIITDIAQDAMEDPIGHAERRKANRYLIGSGVVEAVRAALRSASPEPRPDEYVTGMLQRALEIVRLYCGDEDIDAIHHEFEGIGGVALMPPGTSSREVPRPAAPPPEDSGARVVEWETCSMCGGTALVGPSGEACNCARYGKRPGWQMVRRAPSSSTEGERHG